MKSSSPPSSIALGLVLLSALLPLPSDIAQEPPPEAATAAARARIRELAAELEALLSSLPPDERERALAELAAALTPERTAEEAAALAAGGAESHPTTPAPAPAAPPQPAVALDPACSFLAPFDSDGDGQVSTRDRYWRYLYAFRDGNGDGTAQEGEVTDLYAAGVRAVAVDLSGFRDADGGFGRVRADRRIRLALDDPAGALPALLAVDAGRLGRGNGPELVDGSGVPAAGIVALEAGQRLVVEGRGSVTLECAPVTTGGE
jgi:hypothetical protein